MNHQKHTELTYKIEKLKKEISITEDIKNQALAGLDTLEEELDKAEIELINLDLEEDEYPESAYGVEELTPEEQDEASRQRTDDLEASRGQY